MMNYRNEVPFCKFGLNCKYGSSCRFYHPQRQSHENQYQNYSQFSSENMQNIQSQFQNMNLNYGIQEFQKTPENYQFKNQQLYQQNFYDQKAPYKILNPCIQKNYQKSSPNDCNRQKFKQKHHKNKQNQRSSSSDSNSDASSNSDQEVETKPKKVNSNAQKFQTGETKKPKNKFMKFFQCAYKQKPIDYQAYDLYAKEMSQFFHIRHIKQHKIQKILMYLAKNMPYQKDLTRNLISTIEQLQNEGFIQHFCYKRIIKITCKENFQMERIRFRLMKKINVDNKRKSKLNQFFSKFPNPVEVQFLESLDLLQNQQTNKDTIYLIDGNNCLTTQKHLRHYFQKQDPISKAEAQIRFRWLVSLVLKDAKRCFIFFDDKFQDGFYHKVTNQLMTEQDYEQMCISTEVIYAQKNQQADQCIREKQKQLTEKLPQNMLQNIILVSGDRVLVQQCYQIHPIRRSSGNYLIKFIRKYIKTVSKKHPLIKKKLKKILSY